MRVLAVDPGRRKCGLAVVDSSNGILARAVVPAEEVGGRVRQMLTEFSPGSLLVGGSTGSRDVVKRLKEATGMEPEVVDERHTTERARYRYFRDYPPRGLWRLVPLGLQMPPGEYDDYAAVVMAEQFLEREGVRRG